MLPLARMFFLSAMLSLFSGFLKAQGTLRALMQLDSYESLPDSIFSNVRKKRSNYLFGEIMDADVSRNALRKANPSLEGKKLDSLSILFIKKLKFRFKGDSVELSFPSSKKDSLTIKYFNNLCDEFLESERTIINEMQEKEQYEIDAGLDAQYLKLEASYQHLLKSCSDTAAYVKKTLLLIEKFRKQMKSNTAAIEKIFGKTDPKLYVQRNEFLTEIKEEIDEHTYFRRDNFQANTILFLNGYFNGFHCTCIAAADSLKKSIYNSGNKKAIARWHKNNEEIYKIICSQESSETEEADLFFFSGSEKGESGTESFLSAFKNYETEMKNMREILQKRMFFNFKNLLNPSETKLIEKPRFGPPIFLNSACNLNPVKNKFPQFVQFVAP
ncbi:MAG: hypothetical protein IAF38_08320 [Bacteroidia bacterium]|nr:hypothetical protein [Bacteroidia bacterium]